MVQSEISPQELFVQAEAAAAEGHIDLAIARFRQVAAQSTGDSAALTRAGHLLMRRQRPGEAAEVLNEAVARHSDNATAWFLKGEAEEVLERFQDAIGAFREVVRLHADFWLGYARLGALLERVGEREEGDPALAEPVLRMAARLKPADPTRHELHALAAYNASMMEEAAEAFTRQVVLEPGDVQAIFNLASTMPLLGAREKGLDCFHRATRLAPDHAGAWTRKARMARRLGDLAFSIAADRRALILEPAEEEDWRRLIRDSEFRHLSDRIVTLRRRLSVLAPEDEGAIIDLAGALLDADRPLEALEVLEPMRGEPTVSDVRFLVMAQACVAAGKAMPVGVRARYHDWIDTVEPARPIGGSASLADAPVISVVMPVCDPPVALLEQAIASVQDQDYPSWQLCIADDASLDPEVHATLENVARDPKINVVYREERGHISTASNTALSIATGDVVCFLDHDDRLAPGALGAVGEAFADDPELVLVYSDEDKINADGARFDPHFKPDWNPDLLLSQNYVCHLMAIRRSHVAQVGGLRVGFEGSQDHDLTLRVTEGLTKRQIGHIPQILYHWRVMPGSTSLSREAKPYSAEATRRALQDHHDRTGTGAWVEATGTGWVTCWPMPEPAPRVSIIIPTRDRLGLLRRCIDSLRSVTDYPEFEIIIVDNDSVQAETLAYFRSLEAAGEARVMKVPGSFNFSRLNNMAAVAARGDVLCLLNNDIEVVEAGWLREMVSHAVRPGVGIVGAKLLYGDETVQHGGVLLWGAYGARHIHVGLARDVPGRYGRAASLQTLSAVTGACMVMRREVYETVDGLDEAFAADFGDIDLCLRANAAGYRTIWTPHAVLLHHESASRGTFVTKRKAEQHASEQSLMWKRWGSLLSHDPAYNPNLSLDPLDKPFDLAASRRELD